VKPLTAKREALEEVRDTAKDELRKELTEDARDRALEAVREGARNVDLTSSELRANGSTEISRITGRQSDQRTTAADRQTDNVRTDDSTRVGQTSRDDTSQRSEPRY